MKNLWLFLIPLTFALANLAQAKRFTNEYIQFELPPGWECALEGSEWVCQSTNAQRKKEAIIIMVAKIRGKQDTIDQYTAYLKKNKTYSLPGGKQQVSEAKFVRPKEVNGHRWVDALHLASEVPGFYTRYLATVKEDLGIAVTFSVSKEHYELYQKVFEGVVMSMRAFRQKKVNLADFAIKDGAKNILDSSALVTSDIGGGVDVSQRAGKRKKSSGGGGNMMLFGLLALGAVGFIIAKKRKK